MDRPPASAGLDVDAGAERLHARDRLGDDVEGEGAVRRLDHGQADAVDRDRVPGSAGVDASISSLPLSNDITCPLAHEPREHPFRLRLAQVRPEEEVVAHLPARQPREGERRIQARGERRALAREGRCDEEEQLVDEAGAEERRRERRSALEQERLDAGGREGGQLVLDCRSPARGPILRERPATEREPARLSRGADLLRVEARVLQPHRAHADGDRVGGGAQFVHEPPGRLARDPAPAGYGDAPVQRDRLVRDEGPPEREPGAPGLVLAARLEAVGVHRLDALRAQPVEPAARLGVRSSEPATTRAIPAASTASTHGGVVPWWAHGSIVT